MSTAQKTPLIHMFRWTAALILTAIFAIVGLSKIIGLVDFYRTLRESPLLTNIAWLVALIIPPIEVLLAVLLCFRSWHKIAFRICLLLFCIFTSYNVYLVYYAPNVPCGCGAIFSHMSWENHLKLNLFFMGLCLIGTWITRKEPYLGAGPPRLWRKIEELLKTYNRPGHH